MIRTFHGARLAETFMFLPAQPLQGPWADLVELTTSRLSSVVSVTKREFGLMFPTQGHYNPRCCKNRDHGRRSKFGTGIFLVPAMIEVVNRG